MLRIRIWQVEWQTISILVFSPLSAPSPFFIFLFAEVWATCFWLKGFSSVPCAPMVHSSLRSDQVLQWKLSLKLRRVWDEWVVLVWSALLPPLSFSLYLLRILLSLIYLLMLQHILFKPSHYLLKLPWVQADNLIPSMFPRGKGALGQPEHCNTLLGVVVQLIKQLHHRRNLVFCPAALILHFHVSTEPIPFILYSPI